MGKQNILIHIGCWVLLTEHEMLPKRNALPSSFLGSLPSSGLSEVTGIVSDTVLRNTVNDRRIVTPVERREKERWKIVKEQEMIVILQQRVVQFFRN